MSFRPEDISSDNMKRLANHIEAYLDLFEHIMIVPEELMKERKHVIDPAIKTVRQLIKKLRKGDRDVFKDEEDWEFISD